MKYSTRLSDAVHIAAFIHLNPTQDLSSGAIAHSIQTNPSYVRQLMSALKRAGLLHGTRGQAAPSVGVNIQLALSRCYAEVQRSAEARMAEITLSDILRIYEAYVRGNGVTK